VATANARERALGRHGPGPRLMGAGTLIGNHVYNHHDEHLGDITELMLDVPGGRICYAVLAFGGMLGLGEKLFAVPWEALTLDTVSRRFLIDITRLRLQVAPGFDRQAWPDMADPTWEKGVHDYYGTKSFGA
jgi:hypothetical protein